MSTDVNVDDILFYECDNCGIDLHGKYTVYHGFGVNKTEYCISCAVKLRNKSLSNDRIKNISKDHEDNKEYEYNEDSDSN